MHAALIAALALLAACAPHPDEPAPAPAIAPPVAPPVAEVPAYWSTRTDQELDALLRDTCAASTADGRPVLLVFSAPWCVDCQTLARMDQDPGLAGELDRWHRVVIDVGRFERHPALREAFAVHGIAHLAALRPTDCAAPAPSWPRLREGLVEPATGQGGPKTSADVLGWLSEARSR